MTANPYRELHQQMVDAGWTHRRDSKNHHSYRPPEDLRGLGIKPVSWPSTPGRGRSYANTLAKVARALAATKAARTDA